MESQLEWMESFLNVGIVRNGNYIGLYMNLTSYNFLNRSIYENETKIDNISKQRWIGWLL